MDRLLAVLSYIPRALILILMVTLLIDMMLGVFFRYVVGHALPWSEEVGTFCLIWLTFVGGAVGIVRHSHFSIELAIDNLEPKLRLICQVLVALLIAIAGAIVAYNGWLLVLANSTSEMPSLGFSLAFQYAASVVGGLLMMWYAGVLALRLLRAGDGGV